MPDAQDLQGWMSHPAYILGTGNTRLSCAFCVLGSLNDLGNAVNYNRETYQLLMELEESLGWTFQNKRSLRDLESQNSPVEKYTQLALF